MSARTALAEWEDLEEDPPQTVRLALEVGEARVVTSRSQFGQSETLFARLRGTGSAVDGGRVVAMRPVWPNANGRHNLSAIVLAPLHGKVAFLGLKTADGKDAAWTLERAPVGAYPAKDLIAGEESPLRYVFTDDRDHGSIVVMCALYRVAAAQ